VLKKISENPYLDLISGIILLITSGYEIITNLDKLSIGAHHGVAIFGMIQIIKSIPPLLETLKNCEKIRSKAL